MQKFLPREMLQINVSLIKIIIGIDYYLNPGSVNYTTSTKW